MKNLYKSALLAALGLASITAAHATTTDVLLGFNDAAGVTANQNDYVIDLGAANLFTTTANLNLSSLFSSSIFTAAFGSDGTLANHVAVGVVQGNTGSLPKTLYTTGPLGVSPQSGPFNNAAAAAQASPIGSYASTTTGSWSANVAVSPTVGGTASPNVSIAGNPMQYLSSGVITETLYESHRNTSLGAPTAWTILGTIAIDTIAGTINFTGANFVASPVPEPATYGALAGAGLLALSLRRNLNRKNA